MDRFISFLGLSERNACPARDEWRDLMLSLNPKNQGDPLLDQPAILPSKRSQALTRSVQVRHGLHGQEV